MPGDPHDLTTMRSGENRIDPGTRAFYRKAAMTAIDAGVPFLVGGAFAIEFYTGIARPPKDFDLFVRRADVRRILSAFEATGCRIEMTAPHWLAKACIGNDFVDVIFGSANGIGEVDDEWFGQAEKAQVLDLPLELCPVEETIWSKSFVMERDRFDGADVAHLLRARCDRLDWVRLLRRFGENWPVLLTHLVMFGYIYPSERARIPGWITGELLSRYRDELKSPPAGERLCRGTLLSPTQYLADVEHWGYEDVRKRRDVE